MQGAEQDLEPAQPGGRDDDGLVCWVCQFADCDDGEPLLSMGCACCREGSSGGRAHVSCLAGAAAHNVALWYQCPTCKQRFTGAPSMGLTRARWELCRNRPKEDIERLRALEKLAVALLESGDYLAARPLFEELLAVERQKLGDEHPATLQIMVYLGRLHSSMGEDAEAQVLLEAAAAGLRRTIGDEDQVTLTALSNLAAVHSKLGAVAKARLLVEEVVAALRRTLPADPNTFVSIGTLGDMIACAGDCTVGLALQEEAVTSALRELGLQHPCTQSMADQLTKTRQTTVGCVRLALATRANGFLVGLASKPELNGKTAGVVGFDVAKGRYHVRVDGSSSTDKTIGIKPTNLILKNGSAVIVEGNNAAPEWNGKRGLVESCDKGRYRLLFQGRKKALVVKTAYCKLEFAVEAERHDREATMRARVEANVRAALAAREQADKKESANPP